MTGPVKFIGPLCTRDARGVQALVNVLGNLVVGKLNEAVAYRGSLYFVPYQFH